MYYVQAFDRLPPSTAGGRRASYGWACCMLYSLVGLGLVAKKRHPSTLRAEIPLPRHDLRHHGLTTRGDAFGDPQCDIIVALMGGNRHHGRQDTIIGRRFAAEDSSIWRRLKRRFCSGCGRQFGLKRPGRICGRCRHSLQCASRPGARNAFIREWRRKCMISDAQDPPPEPVFLAKRDLDSVNGHAACSAGPRDRQAQRDVFSTVMYLATGSLSRENSALTARRQRQPLQRPLHERPAPASSIEARACAASASGGRPRGAGPPPSAARARASSLALSAHASSTSAAFARPCNFSRGEAPASASARVSAGRGAPASSKQSAGHRGAEVSASQAASAALVARVEIRVRMRL